MLVSLLVRRSIEEGKSSYDQYFTSRELVSVISKFHSEEFELLWFLVVLEMILLLYILHILLVLILLVASLVKETGIKNY